MKFLYGFQPKENRMNKRNILRLLFLATLMILGAAACGGPKYTPEQVTAGETLFVGTCSSCHGEDAKGLPDLGKNLISSEFVHDQSDEDLLAMIKTGRPPGHELNTTGIDMPPKGGNPALSDEDITNIIAYLRSIQE
jgi:disulfide bond formation protein DsbB